MKYTKPGKIKQALRELIDYIDASNGINDPDEWREEIDALKQQHVDPKDWEAFEKIAEQLEVQGLIMAEAYEYMDKVLLEFWEESRKIMTRIKNEKSKKSHR